SRPPAAASRPSRRGRRTRPSSGPSRSPTGRSRASRPSRSRRGDPRRAGARCRGRGSWPCGECIHAPGPVPSGPVMFPRRGDDEVVEPWLAAHLPVLDLALDAVRAVQRAAGRALADRPGAPPAPDPARVAAAFSSDRLLAVDGRPVEGFAPLSGFFRTADGWVRTHANYPHHRTRLTALVGLPDDVGRDAFAQRLTDLSAHGLEEDAAARGAVVVRVRSEQEWRGTARGRAAAAGPLVPVTVAGAPDRARTRARRARGGDDPLGGVRVLDLTRVIAGPVATRTLALLGADVLRVDPPEPAEIAWQHLDTGQGKRSTLLDLRTPSGLGTAQRLLDTADVLVTGYRPGAVEALG